MTSTTITSLVSLYLLGAGCGSSGLGALRFHNHDPVWSVDDRRPISEPAEREVRYVLDDVNALVRQPVLTALEVPEQRAAMNVNSLGEVPDSSWFENRIGVRELSAEQVARGPNHGGPDRGRPWTVHEITRSQPVLRMVVEDGRGERFILKFDRPSQPELESGAEVVAQRLLWAAGYHVPENSIVYVEPRELVVAPDATGTSGEKLTQRDLHALLADTARSSEGARLRALASRYLAGKPVGGYAMSGTRPDDVNDRVPHQHRRDVRGQRLFFAWLGQTDVKESNTLDMWLEQPSGSGRGHLVHYLVDFGKAFGTWANDGFHRHDGWAPHFDYGDAFASLTTFGLWRRPWEDLKAPALRGVGRYEAQRFDPDGYAPALFYEPFVFTDRFDQLWAAKIIARFRAQHVAAAVRAAQYSDPRASVYMVATILARQRTILHSAFSRVNPIDRVKVAASGRGLLLCANDLLLAHRLAAPSATRYVLESFDYAGNPLGSGVQLSASPSGDVCAGPLVTGATHAGYTLIAIRTFRGEEELAPVIVHAARKSGSSGFRVVGIERR